MPADAPQGLAVWIEDQYRKKEEMLRAAAGTSDDIEALNKAMGTAKGISRACGGYVKRMLPTLFSRSK